MKKYLLGFAACYLFGGVCFASAGYVAIPCMTAAGAVYYGGIWPLAPLSVAMKRDLYPIPMWACKVPGEQP